MLNTVVDEFRVHACRYSARGRFVLKLFHKSSSFHQGVYHQMLADQRSSTFHRREETRLSQPRDQPCTELSSSLFLSNDLQSLRERRIFLQILDRLNITNEDGYSSLLVSSSRPGDAVLEFSQTSLQKRLVHFSQI